MRRITYEKFAGVRVKGHEALGIPFEDDTHLDRVLWLIAQVESGGVYGTALNYDGTGMTAGIHQAIAVYPRALDDGKRKNDQGPLWDLMARCDAGGAYMSTIHNNLDMIGMHVTPDGKLRDKNNGNKLVDGKVIRDVLTGSPDGIMPVKGPGRKRGESYVNLFARAFSSWDTFVQQDAHGKRFVAKRADRWGISISDDFDDDWDLASAVFWCNAVNAPAIARKKFKYHGHDPRKLMKSLANSSFGRWNDELPHGRWQRTRRAAMKLWPKHLFTKDGIMPKEYK